MASPADATVTNMSAAQPHMLPCMMKDNMSDTSAITALNADKSAVLAIFLVSLLSGGSFTSVISDTGGCFGSLP